MPPLGHRTPDQTRLLRHVLIGDGCWSWIGALRNGYGVINGHRRNERLAHRVAYETWVGPIPDGLTLDHICHTYDETCLGGQGCLHRRCINPTHLEPVTINENVSRGRKHYSSRTHCPSGHPFSVENTALRSDGGRRCKVCRNAQERRRYHDNKSIND